MKSINPGVAVTGLAILLAASPRLSWCETGFGEGQSLDVKKALADARASIAPGTPAADVIAQPDVVPGSRHAPDAEWVTIGGGHFAMGTEDGPNSDARPVHEVAIKAFEMGKTLVTVEQYAECVSRGLCTEPESGGYCNWGRPGRQNHPINCVSWEQANQYAKFRDARLPTESEYEYAAKNGGKDQKYPWGDLEPNCENVVKGNCGHKGTMPVCSKPAGNTAQGLCDMVGNVAEWVQDMYENSYEHAPVDGTSYEGSNSFRVLRGGSFHDQLAVNLRVDNRFVDAGDRNTFAGFRLARSSR